MDSSDDPHDLEAACLRILRVAERGTPEISNAMLAEALAQMRQLSPVLSGELWDSYAAVLAAAGQPRPSATIFRLLRGVKTADAEIANGPR